MIRTAALAPSPRAARAEPRLGLVVARGVGDGEPGDQDERHRDRQGQQDGEHQRDGGPGPRRGGQDVQQAIPG